MVYEEKTRDILNHLGVCRTYKGYNYIVSSIQFIHKHNSTFLPITKNLYVDIAKQYHTSDKCIEKNIRKVVEIIWKQENNFDLIKNIFGENNVSQRLSNAEFLTKLYDYILFHKECETLKQLYQNEYQFICPLRGTTCKFCNNFVYDIINKTHDTQ